MIFPDPNMYQDWREWARAVQNTLSQGKEITGVQLLEISSSTATGGNVMPSAAATGVMAFSATAGEMIFTAGGVWKRGSTATQLPL